MTGRLLFCDLAAPALMGLDCILGPDQAAGGVWPVHIWVRLSGDPFDAVLQLKAVKEWVSADALVTVTADKVVIGDRSLAPEPTAAVPLTFSRV